MSDPAAPAARLFALVPCAGVGERSGADRPKQYVPLAGRALVEHALHALRAVPDLSGVLVVLAPADSLFEQQVPGFQGPGCWVARCGGASRADTVLAGLLALRGLGAQQQDWVLVHDAARCLLHPRWVQRLVEACRSDPVGGLLAVPVADTLKDSAGGRVTATVARTGKWAAQTPQMFRLGLLQQALEQGRTGVTDEASAVEALGLQPLLVEGDMENFKVTYPGDFILAERLLATRGASPQQP
jgi:2-C-methyl-D-erythritol 4-phosphate cytidylyltransferase